MHGEGHGFWYFMSDTCNFMNSLILVVLVLILLALTPEVTLTVLFEEISAIS
jgi:hypothetical protein